MCNACQGFSAAEASYLEPPIPREVMVTCTLCCGMGLDTHDLEDCSCPCMAHTACRKCGASHRCQMCHGAGEIPEALSRPDEYEPE